MAFKAPEHSSVHMNRCAQYYKPFTPVGRVLSQARSFTHKIVPFRPMNPGHKIALGDGLTVPKQYNDSVAVLQRTFSTHSLPYVTFRSESLDQKFGSK